ncbi:MAG: N-acyl-L-amino acid amidohydrolase [Epulopiscium sp. Nele67-Bin005]|nr:MAG: N-acyl-L-amino acid amidohydrolase [Epulopiscium sp. Nele67-Bin005]
MVDINLIGDKYLDEVVTLRELIHMYPEDGFLEFKTSQMVADVLEGLGLEVTKNVAKTGVVGLLKGKYEGKTILLRADMDALKLEELADVPYKSKVKGMMHACAHDGHTAGLLGAAMILSELKDELHGNVKLIFQPAEEEKGGALPMIQEGVLDNPKVDIAVGAHLWGSEKAGEIHVKEGAMMASPTIFTIKVIGKGGHCAMPHQTIDPTIITAQIINNLQSVVSRMSNPLEPVVLSIGQIHAGHCFNVIPNEVFVEGSVRIFDENTAKRVEEQMESIIKGITEAYGAEYEFNFRVIYPPVINNGEIVNLVKSSTTKILGEEKVFNLQEPSMGGEDFSYFGHHVPSAFFFLGIGESKENPTIHHNPYFNWDSKITLKLSKCMAQIAYDYLQN